jgi:hypothetical protein
VFWVIGTSDVHHTPVPWLCHPRVHGGFSLVGAVEFGENRPRIEI